jgi:hypothetical protein
MGTTKAGQLAAALGQLQYVLRERTLPSYEGSPETRTMLTVMPRISDNGLLVDRLGLSRDPAYPRSLGVEKLLWEVIECLEQQALLQVMDEKEKNR